MNYYKTGIFYSIILLLILAMVVSVLSRKKELEKEILKPAAVFSEIIGLYGEMNSLLDSLGLNTDRVGNVPWPGSVTGKGVASLKQADIEILQSSFDNLGEIDSVIYRTDEHPEYVNLHSDSAAILRYHALLLETEGLIKRYDSMAIRVNYHMKRFPQNIYINLFHFNLLPLFQPE